MDFALATGTTGPIPTNWEKNQELNKPENAIVLAPLWYYDGTNCWQLPEGAPPILVTDSQESRSMIARSRTKAVGALAGVGGVIDSSVDLQTQLGFYETKDEHSAQWTRPIQTSRPYYIQVLISLNP